MTKIFSVLFFVTLVHSSVQAAELCSGIFLSESVKIGGTFLHARDGALHTTVSVEHAKQLLARKTGKKLNKPADKINQWLEYLTRLAEHAETSPQTRKFLKELFYKDYVIKPEEVPEGYFILQQRIARERGHGDVELSEAARRQMAENVVMDMKYSLDPWVDFMVSPNTAIYPMWLKYWMFQGMTKLAKYDATTGTFANRKGTASMFPDVNYEALAYIVDIVVKKFDKQSLAEIKDPELLKELDNMNFGKLYGRVLFSLGVGKDGSYATNQGKWVKYPKGSDHRPLVAALAGRNTDWCTAGEATAKEHLAGGDFHIYFSNDKDGNPVLPRVAIRMKGDDVAEVRGVAPEQNLDSQISNSNIIPTKMKEFGPRSESFFKKDSDMRMLTAIENKVKLQTALSNQDLRFLWELDHPIEGFGHKRDTRIEQLQNGRNKKADFVVILDGKYTAEQISFDMLDAITNKTKIHFGNYRLQNIKAADTLHLPEVVHGSLTIEGLEVAKGLKLPQTIMGDLILPHLLAGKDLDIKDVFIAGNLRVEKMKSAEGLDLSKALGKGFWADNLVSGKGIVFPRHMKGTLSLGSVATPETLVLPEALDGNLQLGSIRSTVNLVLPKKMNGELFLGIRSAKGLVLPEDFTGQLHLQVLTHAEGLNLTDKQKISLNINYSKSIEGLKFANSVMNGSVTLSSLETVDTLVFAKQMHGNIGLVGLNQAHQLIFPEKMQGNILATHLNKVDVLVLPKEMRGDLIIPNLAPDVVIVLPEVLHGKLKINKKHSARALKLPQGVTEYDGPADIQR